MRKTTSPLTTVSADDRAAGMRAAWRSPFFRRKLQAAGLAEGEVGDEAAWQAIPLTTKDELRGFSAAEFATELVIAPQSEIAMCWRSGGVTGRPLFYPKARSDVPGLVESFRRVLDLAGVQAGDLAHNSFPYAGVHPIGHMFGHALQAVGAGNVFAGSGANTPSDDQVELLFALKPTVWLGIGSYLTQMGHKAALAGHDAADSPLRVAISSAEPLTPAKRARMERTWGVELFDCYGMTECSMMGAECAAHDGLHMWTDLFQIEVLDPETHEPVPDGTDGLLVVTPFHSMNGIPFVRWSPGDIGRIEPPCDCPHAHYPRVRLGSRTVGFSKVRGVNINHNDLEDALLATEEIADFMATVQTTDATDELLIEVEAEGDADPTAIVTALVADAVARFEVRPRVVVVERGTVLGRLEQEIKQVRVRDRR